MKNKKFIWILLPGVLIIWGLIFFQVRKAVSSSNQPISTTVPLEQLHTEVRDSSNYKLKLDYADPFLKNRKPLVRTKSTANPTPKKITKPKVMKTITKLPLKWPNVVYKGLISNKKGNKSIYLLEVDGASLLMTAGEERDHLKLLKAYQDSVRVEYKGDERRTFIKP